MRILHLEDSLLDHQLACRALIKTGESIEAQRVDSLDDFLRVLEHRKIDIILADYRLPGFTAMDAWNAVKHMPQCPPFVLLSGAIGEAAAVAAIQSGIADYLHKDELTRLGRVIQRALDLANAHASKERAVAELAQSEQRLAELASHLQTAIEQERAAIAREIHDDIGGSLAAVKLDLSWVTRHTHDAEHKSHLKAANDMLQHAIGASQRIMLNLRPAILDQGLFAAIQWLASSFEKRTGIKTTVNIHNQALDTPKFVELPAYRTAQEALTNISKYAACTHVGIDISDAEGVLTVEIADNGPGITADNLCKANSFGLRGLQERAKTIGGWLDISTEVGKGTSIILSVPLDPSTSATALEEHFQ